MFLSETCVFREIIVVHTSEWGLSQYKIGHTGVCIFAIVVTKLQINQLVLAEWMMCNLEWSDWIFSYGTECMA